MKDLNWTFRLILFITGIWFVPGPLDAQVEQQHVRQVDTIFLDVDPFEETRPMKITLTLDLKQYQREKHRGKYMPVHYRYEFSDTESVEKEMRLKARGSFRRSHCNMAPFWLNIRADSEKDGDSPESINRFKIVTHCRGAESYEEYVLKEYLCYKIYNIIAPVSFRVRLIRMTYVDTGRKNKTTEGWAFMIEPEKMLAQRTGGAMVKRDNLGFQHMRPFELDVLALFQYMIGNTDYSIGGRHNVKIFGLPGYGSAGYTPVPYDFDYTGLVDSYYAIPAEGLSIRSVRERYFLGPCRGNSAYLAAIEHLNLFREDILLLVNEFEYLEEKDKMKLLAYLEAYFNLAANSGTLAASVSSTCR